MTSPLSAEVVSEAVALTHSRKERGNQASYLRLMGEFTALSDAANVEQAIDFSRQALTLAEELGMRPLAAHCHRGLGKLYSQIEQAEQARVELPIAIEMYRNMEMTFWLLEAAAALDEMEGR